MNRGQLTAGAGLALVRGQTDVFLTVNVFLNIQHRDFSNRVIDKQLLLTFVMAILTERFEINLISSISTFF